MASNRAQELWRLRSRCAGALNLIGTLLRTPIRHLLYLRTHVATVLESIHGQ